jgi:hypothetical protein
MSIVEFGTVFGTQLAAVFQWSLVGFRAQVALPAKEGCCVAKIKGTAAMKHVSLVSDAFMRL